MEDATDDSWVVPNNEGVAHELQLIRVNMQMCLDMLLRLEQRLNSP